MMHCMRAMLVYFEAAKFSINNYSNCVYYNASMDYNLWWAKR